jgi:hypothetical protein
MKRIFSLDRINDERSQITKKFQKNIVKKN